MNDLYTIQHENDINTIVEKAVEYGWFHSTITKKLSMINTYIIIGGILLNSFSCFLSVGQYKIQEINNIQYLPIWIVVTNISSSLLQLIPTIFKLHKTIEQHFEMSEKFKNIVVNVKNTTITTHNKDDYFNAYTKQIEFLINQSTKPKKTVILSL